MKFLPTHFVWTVKKYLCPHAGSVFPSGCHRHPPSRPPRFSHLEDFTALNAELNLRPTPAAANVAGLPPAVPGINNGGGGCERRSSRSSGSGGDCWSCRSGSARTLSHDSGLVKETASDIASLRYEHSLYTCIYVCMHIC